MKIKNFLALLLIINASIIKAQSEIVRVLDAIENAGHRFYKFYYHNVTGRGGLSAVTYKYLYYASTHVPYAELPYNYNVHFLKDEIRDLPENECREHMGRLLAALKKDKDEDLSYVFALILDTKNEHYLKIYFEEIKNLLSDCKLRYIMQLAEISGNKLVFQLLSDSLRSPEGKEQEMGHLSCLVHAAAFGFIEFIIAESQFRKKQVRGYNRRLEKPVSILKHCDNSASKQKTFTSPLHAAVDRNKKACALYLLQCGADPLVEDHEKDTAMTIVNRRSAANPEFRPLQLLLLLFVNYRKKVADTGSHQLAHPAIFTMCPALVSVHNKDGRGNTLLHAAVEEGNWEVAKKLLEIEPLLFAEPNNTGHTPIMLAVAHKHVMLKELVAYACKIDVANQLEVPA